jgi:kynurenine formamidase
MSQDRWGRWGDEDERGTLNTIGQEQVRAAAALVRKGEVLSLGQTISSRTPVPQHRAPPGHFMMRTGGDYAAGARRPGGFQFAEDALFLPLHLGTHIDSLCHVWYDDRLYNGHAQSGIRSSGASCCGVEKLPPIVTRGVLLDLVAGSGHPLPDGHAIGVDELKRATDSAGVSPANGDAVLLRTGWLEAHQSTTPDFNAEPGLNVEAAEWLAECGVALIGADNYAIEAMPFPDGFVFPVHQRLIRDYGMPLLEGLVLKPLAETGATAFLFIAAPLRIEGGTASPVAPVAIL